MSKRTDFIFIAYFFRWLLYECGKADETREWEIIERVAETCGDEIKALRTAIENMEKRKEMPEIKIAITASYMNVLTSMILAPK